MSGHSKWAQIKHKKAATDAKKGKTFSKLIRMITVAAKEKGGDPETNPKLRTAIDKARALGMPSDNIERAIKRGIGSENNENLEEVVYEAFGPGGAALIITGITDNKNRTTAEIKHILAEYGGRLAEKGSVEWLFSKMSAFDIEKTQPNWIRNHESDYEPEEKLELALIDAGAEDIVKNESLWTIYVSPSSGDLFKNRVFQEGIKIKEEYFDYLPKNPVADTGKENKRKLTELMEALDNQDDIQEIYTNVNI